MTMNRRAFVGLVAAFGASLALPKWARALPVRRVEIAPRLWGDGAHDDTAALQWYVDRATPIPQGDYYITRTLVVRPGGRMVMEWSRLTGRRGVEPLILAKPHGHVQLWWVRGEERGPA